MDLSSGPAPKPEFALSAFSFISTGKAWFMFEGDAVYFTTGPASHKARRIARGSPLLVWVGAREGPHFVGHAELIDDPAVATRMAPEYDRKYWIAWLGFFRPNPERVRAGKTVIVRVIPGT